MPLRLFSLLVLLLLSTPAFAQRATRQTARTINVTSSPIVGEIVVRKQQQPTISAAELARFANELVDQKGFDYQFDVCDIVPGRKFTAPTRKVRLPLTLTDGKKLSFNVEVESNEESFCGECFSYLPSRQVLKNEMLLIANGKQYRVRRPASLQLDEAFWLTLR